MKFIILFISSFLFLLHSASVSAHWCGFHVTSPKENTIEMDPNVIISVSVDLPFQVSTVNANTLRLFRVATGVMQDLAGNIIPGTAVREPIAGTILPGPPDTSGSPCPDPTGICSFSFTLDPDQPLPEGSQFEIILCGPPFGEDLCPGGIYAVNNEGNPLGWSHPANFYSNLPVFTPPPSPPPPPPVSSGDGLNNFIVMFPSLIDSLASNLCQNYDLKVKMDDRNRQFLQAAEAGPEAGVPLDDGFIFVTEDGKPLDPNRVRGSLDVHSNGVTPGGCLPELVQRYGEDEDPTNDYDPSRDHIVRFEGRSYLGMKNQVLLSHASDPYLPGCKYLYVLRKGKPLNNEGGCLAQDYPPPGDLHTFFYATSNPPAPPSPSSGPPRLRSAP